MFHKIPLPIKLIPKVFVKMMLTGEDEMVVSLCLIFIAFAMGSLKRPCALVAVPWLFV